MRNEFAPGENLPGVLFYERSPRVRVLKIFERINSITVQDMYTVKITATEYGIKYGLS